MSEPDAPWMIAVSVAAAIALPALAALAFRRSLPPLDRRFMDPLSLPERLAWPLVRFIAHYFARSMSAERATRIQRDLVQAGWDFRMTPQQFFSLRLLSVALITGCTALALLGLDRMSLMLLVAASLFGYAIPALKLREARRRRALDIVRMLPTYLDFITMAVEAGLSLPGALQQATQNGPDGLLKKEIQRVNRDIKAGAGRIEALEAMAERLNLREVTGVVAALAQADRSGGSVGETLRIQADQQRVERFQRAEKLAMEAPVKLIFPLVAFIFPTTFLVLAFPILMKLLHDV
jgi:tight adherence protein C